MVHKRPKAHQRGFELTTAEPVKTSTCGVSGFSTPPKTPPEGAKRQILDLFLGMDEADRKEVLNVLAGLVDCKEGTR